MEAESEKNCKNFKADMSGKALILNNEDVRVVLVGKTGAGKSATGNTILGHKAFKSKFAAESVTFRCEKASSVVKGRKVYVIDTPGLFDTRFKEEETLKEIKQCICFAAPGPHVFLIVIKLGRFTKEEHETVQMIWEAFGQTSAKYTMILFTHGDQLEDESVEEIVKGTPKLQELVSKCEGRYHVFNNKTKDPSQVTELLEKINNMVLKNGGNHYTTEMFQAAERAIEEEKQNILKENEEKRREEEEALKKTHKGEALKEAKKILKEKHEREARAKAEIINTFMSFGLMAAGAGIGAAVGVGLVFGSVGALVGCAVGGFIGAAAVHGTAESFEALSKALVTRNCFIQ